MIKTKACVQVCDCVQDHTVYFSVYVIWISRHASVCVGAYGRTVHLFKCEFPFVGHEG